MGVLNLTPDSFSDGGRYPTPAAALRQARQMVAQGADLLDLGGQSTRPGATEINASKELARVLPVLELIRASSGSGGGGPLISIDTFRAPVAAAALAAGAHWINDVSGGRRDPGILSVVAEFGCPYVLMHSRGDSRSMDGLAAYADVVAEVREELLRASEAAHLAGVRTDQLIWDPGLGFAKTTEHNLALLRGLADLRREGFPLLVGPSRKRFIGAVLNEPRPRARLWGTAAVCAQAITQGADVLRVHDVAPIVQTARMVDAIVRSAPPVPAREGPDAPVGGFSANA
ncbi:MULTISPECIES: dihydropteroate synthase [unclassified Synechococcus]|uniref:dihydropteroate synthase n=1 Tax=unclassified Synechococcus TaxID=2626047 RepID=UPI0021A87DFA|nr:MULTISPECIES: dihydropteroate synthase [unclassified Synechococcus]MCT0212753.1 dihydropteroate synthase [Synechococcus sp. CS-1326]MCT0232585.1 dihydropteroate synthase [Synechococcus sp. CS-1327]